MTEYYIKVKISGTELFFNNYEDFHTFGDLFFKANKNNDFFYIALSNKEEFEKNTKEEKENDK